MNDEFKKGAFDNDMDDFFKSAHLLDDGILLKSGKAGVQKSKHAYTRREFKGYSPDGEILYTYYYPDGKGGEVASTSPTPPKNASTAGHTYTKKDAGATIGDVVDADGKVWKVKKHYKKGGESYTTLVSGKEEKNVKAAEFSKNYKKHSKTPEKSEKSKPKLNIQ
jgi:hypothetical protein